MTIAITWLFFAVLVGIYADRRGRSGFGWFLLAVLISPLLAGLLCLVLGPLKTSIELGAPNPETHVKCPDCRELVLRDARVCKHCGAQLVPHEAQAAAAPEPTATDFNQVWQRNKAVIIVLLVIAILAVVSTTR